MSVTKYDIVTKVADQLALPQRDVTAVIDATLETISQMLCQEQKIELRRFGTFSVKIRKGGKGRNPANPEATVVIMPHAVPRFKPSAQFKALVRESVKVDPAKFTNSTPLPANVFKIKTAE